MIQIWNRETQKEEVEKVYGEHWLSWAYQTPTGKKLTRNVLSHPWVSSVYGAFQSTPLSRRKIAPFIRDFSIPMTEFEERPFRHFNDCFTRKFKKGMRPFVTAPDLMPAFAEARYFAWEKTDPSITFPVKGDFLTADLLLGSNAKAEAFAGGPVLLARLCPVDYHRFHFPDDGVVLESFRVPGPLHSVNPIALASDGTILCINERQVTLLATQNFGKLAYIEVGALCVGKIIQSYPLPKFSRGDEKGYFLFGGSTVIVLGERGRWKPSADLLEQTKKGRETLVKLGTKVASRVTIPQK